MWKKRIIIKGTAEKSISSIKLLLKKKNKIRKENKAQVWSVNKL